MVIDGRKNWAKLRVVKAIYSHAETLAFQTEFVDSRLEPPGDDDVQSDLLKYSNVRVGVPGTDT